MSQEPDRADVISRRLFYIVAAATFAYVAAVLFIML